MSLLDRAITTKVENKSSKLVLIMLCYLNKRYRGRQRSSNVEVSYGEISEFCSMHYNSALSAISNLEKMGLIKVVRNTRNGGYKEKNSYEILI